MTKPASAAWRAPIFLAAISFLAAAGCGGKTPSRAAQSYCDDLKLYNYPAAYQMLSHPDQIDRTMDQFLSEIPLAPDVSRDWFKTIVRATDYDVGDSKEMGDKTSVTVKVTRPDLILWERTINANLGPNDALNAAAQKQVTDKAYPKETYNDNVVVTKQGDDWKLVANFSARENILKMRKDAIDAFHKFDYDKSISTFQSAIAEIDKSPFTGGDGLKFRLNREMQEIQNAKNQDTDLQAYLPKLALTDVDMKMAASRVPGIFGKITNNGDKGIDDIEFTINYFEGKGNKKKQVFSETHTPITTPFEFTNFNRPVLPFVPGETRQFGFRMTAPADVQQKATPDLNITHIFFTQSTAPLPKPPPSPTPTPAPGASPGIPEAPGAAASSSLPPLPSPPKAQ